MFTPVILLSVDASQMSKCDDNICHNGKTSYKGEGTRTGVQQGLLLNNIQQYSSSQPVELNNIHHHNHSRLLLGIYIYIYIFNSILSLCNINHHNNSSQVAAAVASSQHEGYLYIYIYIYIFKSPPHRTLRLDGWTCIPTRIDIVRNILL